MPPKVVRAGEPGNCPPAPASGTLSPDGGRCLARSVSSPSPPVEEGEGWGEEGHFACRCAGVSTIGCPSPRPSPRSFLTGRGSGAGALTSCNGTGGRGRRPPGRPSAPWRTRGSPREGRPPRQLKRHSQASQLSREHRAHDEGDEWRRWMRRSGGRVGPSAGPAAPGDVAWS